RDAARREPSGHRAGGCARRGFGTHPREPFRLRAGDCDWNPRVPDGDVTQRMHGEKGAALLEAAITVPIILLISVGIFEFGRAYQTWQASDQARPGGGRPGGTTRDT